MISVAIFGQGNYTTYLLSGVKHWEGEAYMQACFTCIYLFAGPMMLSEAASQNLGLCHLAPS